uniref:Uncharacterized protein n=1 Tax=Triticum urartu TaxID=4572 RepID=A0A8R7V3G7_TRIUA
MKPAMMPRIPTTIKKVIEKPPLLLLLSLRRTS